MEDNKKYEHKFGYFLTENDTMRIKDIELFNQVIDRYVEDKTKEAQTLDTVFNKKFFEDICGDVFYFHNYDKRHTTFPPNKLELHLPKEEYKIRKSNILLLLNMINRIGLLYINIIKENAAINNITNPEIEVSSTPFLMEHTRSSFLNMIKDFTDKSVKYIFEHKSNMYYDKITNIMSNLEKIMSKRARDILVKKYVEKVDKFKRKAIIKLSTEEREVLNKVRSSLTGDRFITDEGYNASMNEFFKLLKNHYLIECNSDPCVAQTKNIIMYNANLIDIISNKEFQFNYDDNVIKLLNGLFLKQNLNLRNSLMHGRIIDNFNFYSFEVATVLMMLVYYFGQV